jgi:hypothetical protein
MGHKAIVPAYPETRRDRFVPHTPLLAERWTGVLEVLWQIDPKHPVVIGAGWFGVRGGEARPTQQQYGPHRRRPLPPTPREIVAEIVRRGSAGLPVLPGSSLKGAVRQVYELLTPSCRLARGAACRVKTKDSEPRVCPACSLFGAAGLGGRLAFGEAEPAPGAGPRLVKTPVAWQPRRWEEGTVRVYDRQKAVGEDRAPAREVEPTWAVSGPFRSRLRLVNASAEELGLLFASLGLGAPTPSIRLGGKKYHGLGAVDVQLQKAVRRHPTREVLEGAVLQDWIRPLVEEWVEKVEPRQEAWDALHEALQAG